MGKAIDTAVLFEHATYRFAQAFVWRSTRVGNGAWQSDRSVSADDVVARSGLNAALAKAKSTDGELQAATRSLVEALQQRASWVARSRGFVVSTHHKQTPPAIDVGDDAIEDLVTNLNEMADAHQQATIFLLEHATRFRFRAGGAFNQALVCFEQNRHWEALNTCLSEMAIAGAYSSNPAAQSQGRPAEILGGLWNGDYRLMKFCEAAVCIQAHRSVVTASRTGPAALRHLFKRSLPAIEALKRRGERAAMELWRSQALMPLIDVNDADYVGLSEQVVPVRLTDLVADEWRQAN